MTEWVDKLIPITSHQKAVMVITEVCPVYMPVMAALGFTVDTVYYGDKKNEMSIITPRDVFLGTTFSWL